MAIFKELTEYPERVDIDCLFKLGLSKVTVVDSRATTLLLQVFIRVAWDDDCRMFCARDSEPWDGRDIVTVAIF